MDWREYLESLIEGHVAGVPSISDIVIRDNGSVYASIAGHLEYCSVPSELQAHGAFDDLISFFEPTVNCNGMMCYESAWTLGVYRFRISLGKYLDGRELVMRLLPSKIPEVADIGFPEDILDYFLRLENGLVLVIGATGSGKSTTMASLLQEMGRRFKKRILTIEDPIEYVYPSHLSSTFTQREVGKHCDSFGDALIKALRQLPNVINVGEIRDTITAETALQAAESGHLVISTMHITTPDQAVQRYLKLIPKERVAAAQDTLSSVLQLCVGQRLVKSDGMDHRVSIHEIMVRNSGVAGLIRNGDFHLLRNVLETSRGEGMCTFEQSINDRKNRGLLAPDFYDFGHH